jgi:hypothetical protein
MDRRFWTWSKDEPLAVNHPLKVWPDGESGWQQDFPVYRLKTRSMFFWGQNLEEGIGSGPDTGFRALNLADILGADPIYLLGYDMQGADDGKQAWWHDGYEVRQRNKVYRRYQKAQCDAADSGRVRGRVINLNPDTALRAWPVATVESVFGAK